MTRVEINEVIDLLRDKLPPIFSYSEMDGEDATHALLPIPEGGRLTAEKLNAMTRLTKYCCQCYVKPAPVVTGKIDGRDGAENLPGERPIGFMPVLYDGCKIQEYLECNVEGCLQRHPDGPLFRPTSVRKPSLLLAQPVTAGTLPNDWDALLADMKELLSECDWLPMSGSVPNGFSASFIHDFRDPTYPISKDCCFYGYLSGDEFRLGESNGYYDNYAFAQSWTVNIANYYVFPIELEIFTYHYNRNFTPYQTVVHYSDLQSERITQTNNLPPFSSFVSEATDEILDIMATELSQARQNPYGSYKYIFTRGYDYIGLPLLDGILDSIYDYAMKKRYEIFISSLGEVTYETETHYLEPGESLTIGAFDETQLTTRLRSELDEYKALLLAQVPKFHDFATSNNLAPPTFDDGTYYFNQSAYLSYSTAHLLRFRQTTK